MLLETSGLLVVQSCSVTWVKVLTDMKICLENSYEFSNQEQMK